MGDMAELHESMIAAATASAPLERTPADDIISHIEAVLDHLSGEQKTGYLLGFLIAARLRLESMDLKKMAKEISND
jgi:hypothetical protein